MRNGRTSVRSRRQRRVAGDAEAAADLDRAVDDPADRLGDVRLGDRGLVAAGLALVERPGAAARSAARLVSMSITESAMQLLDHAELAERLPEGLALGGAVEGDV